MAPLLTCMVLMARFYVMQVLHPIGNPASCVLYVRWGRVGEKGQSQTKVSGMTTLNLIRQEDCAHSVRFGL